MTFRVDVNGKAAGLNHSHYSALQVKNAIVDLHRNIWEQRLSIDLEEPTNTCWIWYACTLQCALKTPVELDCILEVDLHHPEII